MDLKRHLLLALSGGVLALLLMPGYAGAEMYWKDWNGDQPGGYMPDINQNQNFDGNADDTLNPIYAEGANGVDKCYCCPTAEANSIIWFDKKADFDPNFAWAKNVVPAGWTNQQVVQEFAKQMDTNGQVSRDGHSGTYQNDQLNGTIQYLDDRNLGPNEHAGQAMWFDVHQQMKPTFQWVEAEVERCQDVKLWLDFVALIDVDPGTGVNLQWACDGAHCVTVAGVDSENFRIALSDPDDGINADGSDNTVYPVYNVMTSDSPCGLWELAGYLDSYPDVVWAKPEPCWCDMDWMVYFDDPGGAIQVQVHRWAAEVGEAMAVSPVPEPATLSLLALGAAALMRRKRRG